MTKQPVAVTPAEAQNASSVDAFLKKVNQLQPARRTADGKGRLVFAMDATMSRQPTWDRALSIQSEMFTAAGSAGSLEVQLVYFRGFRECRASRWVQDAASLANAMTKVDCRGGNTQIARVLSHAMAESKTAPVSAVVFVGDAMEENVDELCELAGRAGMLGIPFFMFQEGNEAAATRAFKEIARLTRGAHFHLDQTSASILKELLAAAAAYASGGRKALERQASKGGAAALLLKQLPA
ncbi:MAG: VWA domain-containing protein [Aestuariivirga sp.]